MADSCRNRSQFWFDDTAIRPVVNSPVNTANNRLSSPGWQYDAAGKTAQDAEGRSFIYDGENKQTEVRNAQNQVIGKYYFDGDGKRIKKYVPPSASNPGETTVFVYDASAKLVAEYSTGVESPATAKVSYLTNDHLGSPRIITDAFGDVVSRRDFMPYGEEIFSPHRTQSLGYTADTIRQKFTGYERDEETGLDFAQARMYHKNYGRFTAPDGVQVTSYRLLNPQALNLYSYVANTPMKFTDPTGQIIKFRNEDDAKKAVELYRNGLTEAEQNAVSYEKDSKGNYVLKIDSKIAEKAGDGSLLKRLHVAATSERVAVVDFLKENDKIVQIKYGVESLKEETSFKEINEETGKEFAGLFLPEFGGKENPKFNDVGLNSAENGVSRILLNTDATFVTMTQAIYAETLSHFQIFAVEGSAKKAAHPAVDFDEASVVEEAGRNEKANKKVPSSPVKKKP